MAHDFLKRTPATPGNKNELLRNFAIARKERRLAVADGTLCATTIIGRYPILLNMIDSVSTYFILLVFFSPSSFKISK